MWEWGRQSPWSPSLSLLDWRQRTSSLQGVGRGPHRGLRSPWLSTKGRISTCLKADTTYIAITILIILGHGRQIRCELGWGLEVQILPSNGFKERVVFQGIISTHFFTAESLGGIKDLSKTNSTAVFLPEEPFQDIIPREGEGALRPPDICA